MLGLEFLSLNEDYILAVLGLNPNCGTGRLCWGKYMNSFLFLMKEIWLALTLKDPSFNPLKLKTVCIKIKKVQMKVGHPILIDPVFQLFLIKCILSKILISLPPLLPNVALYRCWGNTKRRERLIMPLFFWVRSAVLLLFRLRPGWHFIGLFNWFLVLYFSGTCASK